MKMVDVSCYSLKIKRKSKAIPDVFNPDLFEVVVGAVAEGRETCGVIVVAFGDADHHALAGAERILRLRFRLFALQHLV